MLSKKEVLALETVLIRDNECLNYVSYGGGWGGAGNTNTTSFVNLGGRVKHISEFEGKKIGKSSGLNWYGPQVAALVEDLMYVVDGNDVHVRHLFESFVQRKEIAYDTYEIETMAPITDRVLTIETKEGSYTGSVIKGKPEGKGIITCKKGDSQGRITVDGYFVEGKLVRYAVIKYCDGSVYEGSIQDGYPNTSNGGKVIYPDGCYYLGGIKNGKLHGNGVMHHPDGKIKLVAKWKNGMLIN